MDVSIPTFSVRFAYSIRSELAKTFIIKSLDGFLLPWKNNPRLLLSTSRFYQGQSARSFPSLHHFFQLSFLFITLQTNWPPFYSCLIGHPSPASSFSSFSSLDFGCIFPGPCKADSFSSFILPLNYSFPNWPLYPKSVSQSVSISFALMISFISNIPIFNNFSCPF